MNEQGEQIKKNFLEQWIRLAFVLLYIIVFGLLWRFIAILLLVVIILQSLHRVIAAENNSTLLTFSEGLGNFLLKVLQYVLYLSDEKPIDFDAFFGKDSGKTKTAEESAIQPEDVAQASFEAEQEAAEESAQAPKAASSGEDDVFADISFTQQAEESDEAGDDENDEEDPSKKTD
jgi:hypothetical protein